MNRLLQVGIAGVLTFLSMGNCYAADAGPINSGVGQQATIHFRKGSAMVLLDYKTNKIAFRKFDQLVEHIAEHPIDSILIYSYGSPDGGEAVNEMISRERSAEFRGALLWRYPNLKQAHIVTSHKAEQWDAVLLEVENDFAVPNRDQVLSILRSDALDHTKQSALEQLPEGTYEYIENNILAPIRRADVYVIYFKERSAAESAKQELAKQELAKQELAKQELAKQELAKQELAKQELAKQEMATELAPASPQSIPSDTGSSLLTNKKRPLFALKTNLLSDIAITPNLELEIPIGKRWSINVEYQYGWWLRKSAPYCWQIESGGVEARYWFGERSNRGVLTGWFAGVAVSGGMYDFQFRSDRGTRGQYYTAGFTGGYSTPLARNLNLEFSLGLGYVNSDYKSYTIPDGKLIKQSDDRFQSVFPTKAKISLVWVINRNSKRGGTR